MTSPEPRSSYYAFLDEPELFVDKHQVQLIQKVANIGPILDELLIYGVISNQSYDEITSMPTSHDKVRLIYRSLTRSGVQAKRLFYDLLEKHEPHLTSALRASEKEKTMTPLREELFYTLEHLSNEEFTHFKRLLQNRDLVRLSKQKLETSDRRGIVEMMVEIYGQQSVDVTRDVLMQMDKTDLVQSLSETSTDYQELFVDKHQVQLIQKVANIGPILDELLSYGVIDDRSYDDITSMPTSQGKMRALIHGSLSSSRAKRHFYDCLKKHEPHLISDLHASEKAAEEEDTMTSPAEELFNTLEHLSTEELTRFKRLLQIRGLETLQRQNVISSQPERKSGKKLISRQELEASDRRGIVEMMVEIYGQQSVNVTRGVLMQMDRTDLVQSLSETSSGYQEFFVDKHQVQLIQEVANIGPILDELLSFGVIDDQSYEYMRAMPTSQGKMRALIHGSLSSSRAKRHFYDLLKKHEPHLISDLRASEKAVEKEKTMTSPAEELFYTLEHLSKEEFTHFKRVLQNRDFVRLSKQKLETSDRSGIVEMMVEIYGQQSVDVTRGVLMQMDRTDLVQSLSETSSGYQEFFVDKYQVQLIQEVANIGPILDELLSFGVIDDQSYEYMRAMPTSQGKMRALIHGSLSSSRAKRHFYDLLKKHEPHLISDLRASEKAVEKEVFGTLEKLSNQELKVFKWLLQNTAIKEDLEIISRRKLETSDRRGIVEMMVEIYGQRSVNVTRDVLMQMDRTDLVQSLSETSSGYQELFVDKHQVQLIQKVANIGPILDELLSYGVIDDQSYEYIRAMPTSQGKMRALIHGSLSSSRAKRLFYHLLKEHESHLISDLCASEKAVEKEKTMTPLREELFYTLEHLSNEEFTHFKRFLQNRDFVRLSRQELETSDRRGIVEMMVEIYGQQSVDVTRDVLMPMDRTDLVQSLSETSSGYQELFVDKHQVQLIQEVANIGPILDELLSFGVIDDQSYEYIRAMPTSQGKVRALIHGSLSSSRAKQLFYDLLKKHEPHLISDLRASEKAMEEEWILLEPEVNCTDKDEAPTYSLQSEAGKFECSVSGLRWVCKEKVSLKYQFCSLREHMERIERIQYMPAGPLMNITVTAGTLDEVYLPHWICIVDNPTILDKFAILHIDDCGDCVEEVSEVTSSHVKLSEPVFSLKMVLVKVGFSVEINSKILIYKTNTAFLTLHVYLIPPDHGLKQEIDYIELKEGYKRIRKPHPKRPLKMHDWFILTAVSDGAELASDKLPLIYECTEPNFYELFIEKPETDFVLMLTHEKELQPVWDHVIKKEEFQSTRGHKQGEHFVDRHRAQLIDRVDNIASILDELLQKKVIQQAIYDEILDIGTTRDKMRRLYCGPLNAAGDHGKDIFYNLLEEREPLLVADLKKKYQPCPSITASVDLAMRDRPEPKAPNKASRPQPERHRRRAFNCRLF